MSRESAEGGSRPEMAAAIAELWGRHRGEALERVSMLEDVVSALAAGALEPELRERGRAAAHKLRGSAGTYGFERASGIAAQLEDVLAGAAALDLDRVPELSSLVLALREELEGEPAIAGRARGDEPEPGEPAVLLISADELLARALADAAPHGGVALTTAAPDAALGALDRASPDLVLLDVRAGAFGAIDFGLLGAVSSRAGAPPVVVLAGSGKLVDRVEAIRRGAHGFLARELGAGRVIDAVERFASSARPRHDSVLVVDDDVSILAAVEAILEHGGLRVRTLSDPRGFWEALEDHRPDLVLLDLDMPEINGIELCQAVRGDPAWAWLPIVILTAFREQEVIRRAFGAGADDYLTKPIVEGELLARVRNRLERALVQRAGAERDPLTAALTRQAGGAEIERLAELAAATGEPLSVGLIDVDGLRAVNERGHAAGDAYLRRLGERLLAEFESDPVVRWDGDAFVVAMAGLEPAQAARRVTAVVERMREAGGGLSAGIAAGAGEAVEALVRAAEDGLAHAKRAGGGRVAIAGRPPDAASERVDVAIVEDDDSVVDVLRLALDDQGLATRRLADGSEAVAALTGDPPTLDPRLVLLDWDLPGLDGLSVLRGLRDSGALTTTRVVMLTARATEGEMLRALDLGAADYVSKPFSVPVLIERVRRELAA